ncbi:hypothetical protein GCM10009552_39680 [Rothia nasimurium]
MWITSFCRSAPRARPVSTTTPVARKARSYSGHGLTKAMQPTDTKARFRLIHTLMQWLSTFRVDNAS